MTVPRFTQQWPTEMSKGLVHLNQFVSHQEHLHCPPVEFRAFEKMQVWSHILQHVGMYCCLVCHERMGGALKGGEGPVEGRFYLSSLLWSFSCVFSSRHPQMFMLWWGRKTLQMRTMKMRCNVIQECSLKDICLWALDPICSSEFLEDTLPPHLTQVLSCRTLFLLLPWSWHQWPRPWRNHPEEPTQK